MESQPFDMDLGMVEPAAPGTDAPTADLKCIFLELKTHENLKVRGESIGSQSGYQDLIVVDGWGWGVEAQANHTELHSFAQATPTPQAFTFSKTFDSASPTLLAHVSRGKTFRSMLFHVCKSVNEPGGPPLKEFLTIRLDEAFITGTSISGDGSSATQNVSVAFESIRFVYHKVDPDGRREPTGSLYQWRPQQSDVTLDRTSGS